MMQTAQNLNINSRMHEEKRNFKRMAAECPIQFTVHGSDKLMHGTTINISGVGALFATKEKLTEGDMLEILIKPDGSSIMPLNARAQIIRVTQHNQQYQIAAAIQEILR